MGFFDKLKQGLSKTKDSINEKINELYALDNECFKEIYANYMLDSEENNLKR